MNNKTPIHLYGYEVISGTEDKGPNIVLVCSHCSYHSGNSKVLVAVGQKLRTKTKYIGEIYFAM